MRRLAQKSKILPMIYPLRYLNSWASVRHNEIFEISGVSQPPKSKFISQPKTGHVRLYQIRDYGSNPQSIYLKIQQVRLVKKEIYFLLVMARRSVKFFGLKTEHIM